MKKIFIIMTTVLLVISGCALLKGNKKIKELRFDYKSSATINYGHSFAVNTLIVYENGKTKNITSKKGLTITVIGDTYDKGVVSINGYPKQLRADTVFISATYLVGNNTYTLKEGIPFNYNGDLSIAFRGKDGANGEDGKNKNTTILLRNGKDGGDGDPGIYGANGEDLTVNIWKDELKDYYRIKVTNLVSQLTYQYTFKHNDTRLLFDVNGGIGGNGGDGGNGGSGKDGVDTDKKTKRPGDGGNGGNGANGGNGGDGGIVYIFLHPNAIELEHKITVYNFGGAGGNPGKEGKAGTAGTPAGGQDLVPDGIAGNSGVKGQNGLQGSPFQLSIEDFDIEN